MFDKNYFLTRLANGEDMDAIGNELAAVMTEALNEHIANQEAQKAAEAELAKRDLVVELLDIVRELAMLEGLDGELVEVTDADVNAVTDALCGLFQTIKGIESLLVPAAPATPVFVTPKVQAHMSDDEAIANFLAMLSK
jgi:hypothetical protein